MPFLPPLPGSNIPGIGTTGPSEALCCKPESDKLSKAQEKRQTAKDLERIAGFEYHEASDNLRNLTNTLIPQLNALEKHINELNDQITKALRNEDDAHKQQASGGSWSLDRIPDRLPQPTAPLPQLKEQLANAQKEYADKKADVNLKLSNASKEVQDKQKEVEEKSSEHVNAIAAEDRARADLAGCHYLFINGRFCIGEGDFSPTHPRKTCCDQIVASSGGATPTSQEPVNDSSFVSDDTSSTGNFGPFVPPNNNPNQPIMPVFVAGFQGGGADFVGSASAIMASFTSGTPTLPNSTPPGNPNQPPVVEGINNDFPSFIVIGNGAGGMAF